MDALKSAAHAEGCKLNDAFFAALGGGWRRYHLLHDEAPGELQVSFPVSLRRNGGGVVGNNVAVARCRLPIGETDPTRRMRVYRDLIAAHKTPPSAEVVDALAASVNRMPPALIARFVPRVVATNDIVASCVPGLDRPLYLAGSEMQSLYTFGPLAGSAANFTLFSYTGQANVAVSMDPAAIPDPDRLVTCMREGFDEILKIG